MIENNGIFVWVRGDLGGYFWKKELIKNFYEKNLIYDVFFIVNW